jgi:Ca2+-binding EF-hand superfamily protein
VPLEVPGGNLQARYDKQVLDKTDKEVLPRFDTDKDGFISAKESEESDWEPPFESSDIDKDGRLSRFELYERYAKKFSAKGAAVNTSSSGSSGGGTGSGGSGGDDQNKASGFAKGYIAQRDKNKSGALEKEEWGDIKAEHRSADTNNDGVITQEELTAKFAAFGGSSGGGSASAGGGGWGGRGRGGWGGRDGGGGRGDRGTTNSENRKSYRVPSATEKLPKGLPGWFARNDTDADGQIMMAEYMTEFTDSKAAEFARYDLDGDGIITPDECLEAGDNSGRK